MKAKFRNFITLSLVTLLLFKVSGLQEIPHHDDDSNARHCEICIISNVVNFTPLLETEATVLANTEYFFSEQKTNDKALFVAFNSRYLSGYLSTRPPPLFS